MGAIEGMLDGSETEYLSRQHALRLDAEDPLKHLRAEFIIPSRADLKRKTLIDHGESSHARPIFRSSGAYWQYQIGSHMPNLLLFPPSHAAIAIHVFTFVATH